MTMNRTDLIWKIQQACQKDNFPYNITEIFKHLRSDDSIWKAIQAGTNQYQHHDNELLYDLIHLVYYKSKKNFIPVFKYDMGEEIFESTQARLSLSLHSKYSPLSTIFINRGLDFVVVSDYPETIKKVLLSSGVTRADIKTIRRNESCLLKSKKYLKQNYLVSSTIDFHSQMPGAYNMLSDSMMKLALALRPKTFFGLNCVNDLGEMTHVSTQLSLDRGLEGLKNELLGFIAEHKKKAKYQFGKFDLEEQRQMLQSMAPHEAP